MSQWYGSVTAVLIVSCAVPDAHQFLFFFLPVMTFKEKENGLRVGIEKNRRVGHDNRQSCAKKTLAAYRQRISYANTRRGVIVRRGFVQYSRLRFKMLTARVPICRYHRPAAKLSRDVPEKRPTMTTSPSLLSMYQVVYMLDGPATTPTKSFPGSGEDNSTRGEIMPETTSNPLFLYAGHQTVLLYCTW